MYRLFNILRLFKEYFLLSFLIAISLLLFSLNDSRQIKQIRSYAVGVIGFVQSNVSVIPNFFDLIKENEALQAMNVALTDEVSRLREAQLENVRLRQMLDFKRRSPYTMIAGKVIGKSLHLMRNTITIDLGETDGVYPGMPLVMDRGLVGRIIATSSHYAIGQLLLNKDFRASAKDSRSRVDGIIQWSGGEHLLLKNVPKTFDVQQGDTIITSTYSSVFPPNIEIGRVTRVSDDPGTLFKRIEVISNVDFTRLEEVFVITVLPDTARMFFERKFLETQ
jgi:rod shape-determining protein MreC